MKYDRQVEAALANAAPMEYTEHGLARVVLEDRPAVGVSLSEVDHDYPITLPSRDAFETPSRILASRLSDVMKIMAAYDAQTGSVTSVADLEKKLAHEREHARIVKKLGGSSLYGVQFVSGLQPNMIGWGLAVIPHDWQTTKLGLALAKAYPKEPSPSDLQQLPLLGYESVRDVATHAVEREMPVPRSLRPTLARRISYQIGKLRSNRQQNH